MDIMMIIRGMGFVFSVLNFIMALTKKNVSGYLGWACAAVLFLS